MIRAHLTHYAEGAFSSRHLNFLNLHLGIVNFGQYLRLQVGAIFFLSLGMSLSATCFAMGCLIGLRFIVRTPLIMIPHHFGSKAALIGGQIILSAAFCLYALIKEPGPLLWFSIFLMASGEALYWHAVHTTFATLAEFGKFGRQLSARAIFMGIGAMLAPLATGLVQRASGNWNILFVLTAVAVLISLIPLFFMPEPCPPRPMDWKKGLSVNKAGMKLIGCWGMSAAVTTVIWPINVYLQFGSIEKFGYMMTAVSVISLFISIFVARRIDLGKSRGVVIYGVVLYALAVMMLTLFGRDALTIAIFSALLNLTATGFTQPYNAALYHWAKQTKDPLWFHYWSEFGWDIGNLVVLWGASLVLYLHPLLSMRWIMLAILPALASCYFVYNRYAPKEQIGAD